MNAILIVHAPAPRDRFRFSLGAEVVIDCSDEDGKIIARSESSVAENQYLVRYEAADGRATEAWWGESALRSPNVRY